MKNIRLVLCYIHMLYYISELYSPTKVIAKLIIDVTFMLCEGGFPLMETDEMNYEILKNVSQALKPKAKFIFTTLNALFIVK